MAYYSSNFIAECDRRFGEGLRLRAVMRLNDAQNHMPKSADISPDQGSQFWYESPANGIFSADQHAAMPGPIGHTYAFWNQTGVAWNAVATQILGQYDEWGDPTVVNCRTFTLSAVVKVSNQDVPFGLGVTHPVDGTKKFKFGSTGTVFDTATVMDGVGKCGIIDLGDGWYHLWCAIDTSTDGESWYGDNINVQFYPTADGTVGFQGHYVCNIQVAYNEDYVNSPWPKGLVETTGYALIDGAPGTKVSLHEEESILACNPIRVKREEKPGVVHSSGFQLRLTNSALGTLGSGSIAGAWVQLYTGFKNADEWALVSTGRVDNATSNTEGQLTIDVGDPLRAVMDGTLSRWVRFDTTASGGPISSTFIDENSSSYDNDATNAGVVVTSSPSVTEQRWDIIFTSATAFKLQDDAGTDYTGFDINNDASPAGKGFTVKKEGWNLTAGAYTTGDKFIFDMSAEREVGQLNPPALIRELIKDEDFMNLKVYDVDAGSSYVTPLWSDDADTGSYEWYSAIFDYGTSSVCKGTFESGARVIDLVQQLLRIMQASLYTMPNGQIALWQTEPITFDDDARAFNGDPARPPVNILSVSARDRLDQTYNIAKVKFRSLSDGEIVEVSQKSFSSPLDSDREILVDVDKWEVTPTLIDTTLSKVLRRVESPRRELVVRTTLQGMPVDMDTAISINEPVLGIDWTTIVKEKSIDVFANEVELVTGQEDYLLDDYAIVGDAETDPVGSTIDSTDLIF